MRLALTLLPLLATLSACAEFPELDATITPAQADAPYPDLVPLAALTTRAATLESQADIVQTNVSSRINALQARAANMRGPVISAADRARMLRTIR